MSDHISGPRAIADPAIDITDVYAFPSPENPRDLVLIMNVFPHRPGPPPLFSDAVIHRFRIRSATISSAGRAFAVGREECTFDVMFELPDVREASAAWVQPGRCTAPSGETVSFRVNDEKGGGRERLRVFAGQRLDPFFIDAARAQETIETGKLAFQKPGRYVPGLHVLGIVLKVDWTSWLKGGPMFAVVCETLVAGKRAIRLERVGRPEIKNIIMSGRGYDRINRDLEIRDLYNNEDAFNLSKDYVGTLRARMNANLGFYDGLDARTDWPPDEQGDHPLTDLLLADFLVVDASKPFSETSYFEIEQAMLQGRPHATSGGRWLNDDVIDTLYTTYINGGNGPRISDGVDAPGALSSKVFPYMAPPNAPKDRG